MPSTSPLMDGATTYLLSDKTTCKYYRTCAFSSSFLRQEEQAPSSVILVRMVIGMQSGPAWGCEFPCDIGK
jgi:hypothetical protein